jgi:uncharacterized protein (TIGR03083 family)
VEPDEAVVVEEYLERAPRAADEVARLRNAAAWIGATEALAPPTELHDAVLEAVRSRPRTTSLGRSAPNDPFLAAYLSETARFKALVDSLPDDQLDARTFNGLTVRELVIHMAAMESAVAAAIGRATAPEVTEDDIGRRSAEFIEHFRARPLVDARAVWRASVDAVAGWAREARADMRVHVFGLPFRRGSILVSRSFETWTHADDIREVLERPSDPPLPDVLERMADLSVTTMPVSLEKTGRAHPGKTARVVLTGAGGGDWLIPLGVGEVGASPDVVFTADVVDWCRCAAERLAPEALPRQVEGDPPLADDLAAASSAFATL